MGNILVGKLQSYRCISNNRNVMPILIAFVTFTFQNNFINSTYFVLNQKTNWNFDLNEP